jgi:hypothetical protein
MKYRTIVALILGALPLLAHADWQPVVTSDQYIVTLGATVNGYSGQLPPYAENKASAGPISLVAADIFAIPRSLENELNNAVRDAAVAKGYTYLGGALSGEANVTLTPNGQGFLMTQVSGLSYEGLVRGTETKYGIRITCFARLRVPNIVATAQIGSATGALPESTVGVQAVPNASSDCETSIGWIPIIGSLADKFAERFANGMINHAAATVIGSMKDKLFFERDSNAFVGLNRIVPLDKVIPLPNGSSFAVGQWLSNQLTWILTNSSMTLVLGRGASPVVQPGSTTPEFNVFTGNVLKLNLTVGGTNLRVDLREDIGVYWNWKCTVKPCWIP